MTPFKTPATARGLHAATALLAVVAVASAATVFFLYPDITVDRSREAAAVLAFALIALHLRPQRMVKASRHIESINLDEVLFVPLLLMLEPMQSLIVATIGSMAGNLAAKRGPMKTVFNLAQMVFATSAAIWVVRALGATLGPEPSFGDALIGMVGGVVVTGLTVICVRLIVAFDSGQSPIPFLLSIVDIVPSWLGAVTLGGVAAISVGAVPWSAVLIGGLMIFVARAYALSMSELSARRQAEVLQQAIASLRAHTDPELVKTDLIRAAKEIVGAGAAQLVADDDEDPPHAYSAPLTRGLRIRVTERVGAGNWDDRDRDTLLALAGVAGDVLRSAELIARLRTITNSQSEGVIALDMQTRVTFANPAAVHMLGCNSDEEILGSLAPRQARRCGIAAIPIDFASMVEGQFVAQDADATLGPPDGETLDIAYSITPLRAEGAHVGAVLVLRDVTERRAFQDELTRRALHDELTGLPNRRLLLERLDHALARSSSTGLNHGLLFLDLDRFKLVNDSYGHLIGDKLLIQVGRPARVRARAWRLGRADVRRRVHRAGRGRHRDAGGHRRRRAPAADAAGAVPGRRPPHLHVGVDRCRPHPGRSGPRRRRSPRSTPRRTPPRPPVATATRVSTDASVDEARARLDLEVSLRHGLDEDELELHYQPIVTADGGEVVGCRGAGALAVAAARRALAAAVRSGRRGDRPDRADGALGARGGLPRHARVDAGTPRSPAAVGLGQPVGPAVRPAPAGRGRRRDAAHRPGCRPTSSASRSPRPS